jgi:hypothetical protein
MKFLLDANLPRSTTALLQNLGHEVEDVRDVQPGGSDDEAVAARACANKLGGKWLVSPSRFTHLRAERGRHCDSFQRELALLAVLARGYFRAAVACARCFCATASNSAVICSRGTEKRIRLPRPWATVYGWI